MSDGPAIYIDTDKVKSVDISYARIYCADTRDERLTEAMRQALSDARISLGLTEENSE